MLNHLFLIKRKVFFLMIFLHVLSLNYAFSQTTISGVVIDSLNNPIPFANVYLSKTTFGAVTDSNGKFSLKIRENGYYELIASCIGYISYEQNFYAEGEECILNIKLSTQYIRLNEVTIKASEKLKKKYYNLFVKQFIGESQNSYLCRILNKEDLHLYKDPQTDILKGFSVKHIKIENKALGYNIICELKDFSYDPDNYIFQYAGNYYFQPLNGSKREINIWKQKRLFTYKGSRMQFVRALFSGSHDKENFSISEFQSAKERMKKDTIKLLQISDLVTQYNQFSKTIFYEKPLKIDYLENQTIRKSTKLIFSTPTRIYRDGFYQNEFSNDLYPLMWEGAMANERVADMLPYDYQPPKTKEFSQFANENPSQKTLREDQVFVQTDRNLYYPGDTIFFQAYIKDKLTGLFSSSCNALYVNIYNEQNSLMDGSRYKIDQFSTPGWLVISSKANPGKYRLVAFTSQMQNGNPEDAFMLDLRIALPARETLLTTVNFNKEAFNPGDTLEAVVKLTNYKQSLVVNQKLNCKLLNAKYSIKKDKSRTNEDGISTIKFVLPDTLSTSLKFEIELVNNSDTIISQFDIPFKKQYIDVKFLPEGGTLIAKTEQKIGFNATDIDGEPVLIEGLLKNKDGQILDTIKSGIYGPGKFSCIPENEMYVELINGNYEKNIWPLPKPDDTHFCLSVSPLGDRLIVIDVKSNKNSLDSATIKVTMHSKEFLEKKFRIEELKRITLIIDSLPAGVLSVTLYDKTMVPIAERLVYINADKHLRFDIKSDSAFYFAGQETQLLISATDGYGNAEPCMFSISALDSITGYDSRLFTPGIEYTLDYHPYLANNIPDRVIKEGIENLDNEQRDLLMMVYGWRRYNRISVKNNSNAPKTVNYENIFIKLPFLGANKKLELIELDKLNIRKLVTNRNGLFILPLDSLLNTTKWISIIPDRSSRFKYNGVITMQIPENEKFKTNKEFFKELPMFHPDTSSHIQNQQYISQNDGTLEIPEVVIKAKSKREYYNEYDEMFISAKSIGYENLWSYKRMEDAIIRAAHPYKITDNSIILQKTPSTAFIINQHFPALIVLDGFELDTDGWRIVNSISPSDLSSITVITEPTDGYSLYGNRGRGGVIFINSMYLNKDPVINQRYREWILKNKHDIMYMPTNIYRINKEYYNPGKAEFENKPQLQSRPTVFWKSYVYFNGKDPAIIKYPNLKHKGTVMVTINGVSANNLSGTGKMSYQVQQE